MERAGKAGGSNRWQEHQAKVVNHPSRHQAAKDSAEGWLVGVVLGTFAAVIVLVVALAFLALVP